MNENTEQNQTPTSKPKGLFVHPDIHRRMKLYAVAKGRSLQEATEEVINQWLDANEKEDGKDGQSAQG